MVVLSVIFFLVVMFGLGFSLSKLTTESGNFLERNLMRIGLGIGMFLVLSLLLNLVRIPLDWRIFLILSIVIPMYFIFKNVKNFEFGKFSFKITKYDISIILMLLVFGASVFVYTKGAFSYPYLEDDDSWSHAMSAKYVSEVKTLFSTGSASFHYMDPYPPTYSSLMGVIHQTNDSVHWTLKFFNALVISMGVIFFYFFVKTFTGNYNKALFSTFALASVPAFMSHFIWSISLSVPLYFVSFYCLERIKYDKRWVILSVVMIGASLVVSPTHSTYFGIFFVLYYATKVILERKLLLLYAASGFFGALSSLLIWWGPMLFKHGLFGTLEGMGLAVGRGETIFGVVGTVEKYYTFRDFFIAQKTNMINNPIGIGIFLSLLVMISIVVILIRNYQKLSDRKFLLLIGVLVPIVGVPAGLFKLFAQNPSKQLGFFEFIMSFKFMNFGLILMMMALLLLVFSYFKDKQEAKKWKIITLVWLIVMFYAVNAASFQIKISAFRTWMLFAIPMCIISSEGLWFLTAKFRGAKILKYSVVGIFVVGIIFTSSYQKYTVNTAQWPPGGFWTSFEEIGGYVWLRDNIAPNTRVFTFVNHGAVIGMDKNMCRWCEDEINFQKDGYGRSAEELSSWLKGKDYEYLIIDGGTVKRFGVNESNLKLQEMGSSGLFQMVHQSPGFFLFKVV